MYHRVNTVNADEHYNSQLRARDASLGHEAVETDYGVAEYALGELDSIGSDNYATYARDNKVKPHLDSARDQVDKLSRAKTRQINKYINRHNDAGGEWLRSEFARKIRHASMLGAYRNLLTTDVDYLGAMTRKDKNDEPIIDDNLLLNFLQWHQYANAKEQAKFNETLESQKQLFTQRIDDFIQKGTLPEWVAERVPGVLEKAQFFMDDGMNTTAEGLDGYTYDSWRLHEGNRAFIVIHPHLSEKELDHTLTHELIHTIDGYDVNTESDGLERLFDKDDEGSDTWGPTGLNEAVVETLAHSMSYGADIDVIDPAHRKRKQATYDHERMLLDTLCHAGERPIDVRLFIAAHFQQDGTDTYDGELPIARLKKEIEAAFPGRNVLDRIREIETQKDVLPFVRSLRKEVGRPKKTPLERRQGYYHYGVTTLAGAAMGIVGGVGLGAITAEMNNDPPVHSVNIDEHWTVHESDNPILYTPGSFSADDQVYLREPFSPPAATIVPDGTWVNEGYVMRPLSIDVTRQPPSPTPYTK